jgi:hypothetical protein
MYIAVSDITISSPSEGIAQVQLPGIVQFVFELVIPIHLFALTVTVTLKELP